MNAIILQYCLKRFYERTIELYYTNDLRDPRKDGIKKLVKIKNKIQKQAFILSIGSIVYSSVGLVGGGLTVAGMIAAPFYPCVSNGLIVAGIATGVTSGIAGVTHRAVKSRTVMQLWEDAQRRLTHHEISCEKMKKKLKQLKKELEKEKNDFVESANDVYRVIKLGAVLASIIPFAGENVFKGVNCKEDCRILVTFGIVIDLWSLIWNSTDLSDIITGKLCPEAQKLQDVIDQMERECNKEAELSK